MPGRELTGEMSAGFAAGDGEKVGLIPSLLHPSPLCPLGLSSPPEAKLEKQRRPKHRLVK